MKKHLMIFLLLVSVSQTQGQVLLSLIFGETLNSDKVEFGLEGGYNWSNISGL